jgi:hypothetical protein
MRYTIAAFAAFASIAAAVPQYGYGEAPKVTPSPTPANVEYPSYPVVSSKPAAEYPAYPVSSAPTKPSSKAPEYPAYPASSAPAYPAESKPAYPVYPAESKPAYPVVSKPAYPVHSAPASKPVESCVSSTTITVTVPYPTGSGYPVGPKPSGPAGPGGKPSGTAPAPYPVVPVGTGVPTHPQYPTGTGAYTKPSTPAQFTGAANSLNAAGFVAGVGAFAAFFL